MLEGLPQGGGSRWCHSAIQTDGDQRVVQSVSDAVECQMNEIPAYTAYHPRWYRPRVSTYWWLWRWGYLKFILRELSSVFVAYFVVLILLQLCALRDGPEAYAAFQSWLRTPGIVALNVVSLAFVLF